MLGLGTRCTCTLVLTQRLHLGRPSHGTMHCRNSCAFNGDQTFIPQIPLVLVRVSFPQSIGEIQGQWRLEIRDCVRSSLICCGHYPVRTNIVFRVLLNAKYKINVSRWSEEVNLWDKSELLLPPTSQKRVKIEGRLSVTEACARKL